MSDDTTSPYRRPSAPNEGQRRNAPAVNKNPWDTEPTWPGTEYDDDEAVADGMSDDEGDGPHYPWRSQDFGLQQTSLWDEAIARIFAAKTRSDSP